MKILTAHQPVYLPWLGLFHKIALSDTYVFLDTAQYLKKDWNNRNKIKTAQGWIWLTIPVITKGKREQTLQEVRIDNQVNWKRKHWQSIRVNYSKAPYFHRYADFFQGIYQREWDYLNDLNEVILRFLLNELGIKVNFIKASTELELEGRKSDLVLDMCLKLNANVYIFGALGKNYAEVNKFDKHGISVLFQDYQHPEYSQQFGAFEPYMSVIDLLFNHGDDSLEIIMSNNITTEEILRT
ncbi:MAG: WbqC family protein [Dehalococcoidia bacterium]|nr:WbqC family protein [Dehalococcoidia bacterium]